MLVYRRRNRIATQLLHIGEVARRTGLTVDAIRFYEKERLLRRTSRTSGGFRLFSAEDIARVCSSFDKCRNLVFPSAK